MNIFKRLFNVGKAEAHSAIDMMEDPIKMTEQGIRDMKGDLTKALEGLAQVKAMLIRSKNDKTEFEAKAKDYQSKAMLILQKVQKGELAAEDGDRLAKEALVRKEENQAHVSRATAEIEKFSQSVSQLESNVNKLKSNIGKWENELKTLKARVKVSNATKNLNKQMAAIDSSSTVNMLEKMKEKVAQEEALADAYGDIANESRSIDEEIDKVLDSTQASADNDLDALKKQMGL
ncbi:PspA/IM30 family protein [Wenyingzhuangia sp. 2_MG-2023]|uniref:PspA/IM30 family protein n=1 Tax=Wenyingzhuangia sp. 2_MG-2023 TaxID=3062639 RepID=UPI0026E16BA1|nr:PspA/IM30 family protein [Wenyingzhuangia sp. 2_MG-2023]MDO6736908.1 PspA/IM30 family protein [Wenyingzhuangia sp. 2_MG-2023]MDO6801922.1 PspA/IM30 family protein [Wenyingzhuangia sp. 1_MG-2023]